MEFNINLVAVLVAAVVNMAIGYVWYEPLFGKMWMKLTGRTKESIAKEKADMPKVMGSMFIGALVMSFVLALFIDLTGATGIHAGIKIGALAWLGFVATTILQDVLYEKKNAQLAAINLGYNLTVLAINGSILATWS